MGGVLSPFLYSQARDGLSGRDEGIARKIGTGPRSDPTEKGVVRFLQGV